MTEMGCTRKSIQFHRSTPATFDNVIELRLMCSFLHWDDLGGFESRKKRVTLDSTRFLPMPASTELHLSMYRPTNLMSITIFGRKTSVMFRKKPGKVTRTEVSDLFGNLMNLDVGVC
jgi:hypothetical protein